MFVCVCVCVGGIFGPLFEILGTYRTKTKICLHDRICLGGVDVGSGMEFPFHVLYVTCFCGSWTAPLPNKGSLYV